MPKGKAKHLTCSRCGQQFHGPDAMKQSSAHQWLHRREKAVGYKSVGKVTMKRGRPIKHETEVLNRLPPAPVRNQWPIFSIHRGDAFHRIAVVAGDYFLLEDEHMTKFVSLEELLDSRQQTRADTAAMPFLTSDEIPTH